MYLSARSHRCRRRRGPYRPSALSAHQMAPRSGMQQQQWQRGEMRHRSGTARPQSPTGTCCSGLAPCCSRASRAASLASTSRRSSRTPRPPSGCATFSSVCHLSTPVQQPPLDFSNRNFASNCAMFMKNVFLCGYTRTVYNCLTISLYYIEHILYHTYSFVFHRSLWLDQRYHGCISH